ncbi:MULTISPECIES: Re/Si-specific NAD(P)(+) transhydrogenase subunit alpha [unclassified Colwellia]|jgi:NAD(P) transhydrogenase subunit alpha|uniref:Re/Si-specific NAD(P)(+) transhydrogenase subunit alpha n=1 Tax=unclassified Colwellia TaxID=196834 RepID=UPI0015F7257C|nr:MULTISPECIES: Re/Si-specific NAD(P)(+) transhydrogenase subunit alpha [unclassified Colwellia]MBA6339061.1 Re/Si-specific NAD(P)(+) transhydrogenase subunit alpha [Colwellia sp. BRX8-7]MBA6380798.1 Re/Si-specific NAD(P)(+) transhydrogenase subunit alpha [Colwellia sp. BRX10-7]MBA6388363.1 Re/Si-specific NAD(P)(+) transhydrogenase subunit alpha [Colwellia sp. BRX10-2]MBA6403345.1 Re/Si-specific NAD(P)(+) transhydrogenase subunit alpha [Colwellia sp. BRX10-5]MBA6407276.1 Re/Si-specific NAD(P)
MNIGIPKETLTGENRVAASPSSVVALLKLGFSVQVQKGAGTKASFTDEEFADAEASLVTKKICWQSDIIFKVNAPSLDEVAQMKDGAHLVSFIAPAQSPELLEALREKSITTFAMEMVPRMTRSQSMDALSSMANIAGYRAVIEATHLFGRFLTGQITAAGKMPPAKVMIIGAGVAGLAAIGTAGSLGAVVRAFDTRPEVKEQIESMGAEFLELDYEEPEDTGSGDGYAKEMSKAFIDAEMALFAEQAKDVDIIITTAMIPGKPAPKLITEAMVHSMKPGSIIVDLAAAGGGNCALTVPGKVSNVGGVKIIGYTDLVSRLPNQASQLYSNNLVNLTKLVCPNKDGTITVDFEDQVVRNMTVVNHDEITFPPPPIQVSAAPTKPAPVKIKAVDVKEEPASQTKKHLFMAIGALLFAWVASVAPADFLSHFTVFVLSCVIGYNVVWNVSHSLHTPLMSVTNAISGIIIVGALLQIGQDNILIQILAGIAVLIATINIVGGFVVTKRMLKMFRR